MKTKTVDAATLTVHSVEVSGEKSESAKQDAERMLAIQAHAKKANTPVDLLRYAITSGMPLEVATAAFDAFSATGVFIVPGVCQFGMAKVKADDAPSCCE